MSSYSTALSSLTGGRASFIMKFSSYELVPTDVSFSKPFSLLIPIIMARRPWRSPITSPILSDGTKEGMPVPDTYKFNGQEFKINVKGTEEVPLEWGGKLVFINK